MAIGLEEGGEASQEPVSRRLAAPTSASGCCWHEKLDPIQFDVVVQTLLRSFLPVLHAPAQHALARVFTPGEAFRPGKNWAEA